MDVVSSRWLIDCPRSSSVGEVSGGQSLVSIIWETLLALCGNDLIIVSRDRTFLDNESLLRSEFNIDGKRRLLAVTDSPRWIGKAAEVR
jgi:hypothetical protein